MSVRTAAKAASAVLVLCTLATCGTAFGASDTTKRMMVPNTPGGGYDLTARSVVSVLESAKIVNNVDVFNVVGSNETVAMQRLMKESGNTSLLMTMGMGMVGVCVATGSAVRPSDATAIAELTTEPEGIIVPADSKFRTVQQLVRAWKADPGAMKTGGGSTFGGPHNLVVMELAHAVGIPPRAVNYTPYAGDGQMLPALLNHTLAFGASGLGEYRDQIAAGQVRVLATSGARRLAAFDAPTLKESGIDLVFVNWHALLAPPGISQKTQQSLIAALTRMHGTAQWQRALKVNGWTDSFVTGTRFKQFLKSQEATVADTIKSLGLTRPTSPATNAP